MTLSTLARPLPLLLLGLTLAACSSEDDGASGGEDAGGGGGGAATGGATATGGSGGGSGGAAASASCHVAADHLCDEWTGATEAYVAETAGSCASRGGVHASPAACPTDGFVGKCTLPPVSGGVVLTTRHYTGADLSAQESFCNGIAAGTWSTAP